MPALPGRPIMRSSKTARAGSLGLMTATKPQGVRDAPVSPVTLLYIYERHERDSWSMTGASREHHGERHAGSLAASAGDLVALPRRPAVGSDVYLVGGEEAVHGGGESGSNAAVCTSLGRFRLALLP